MNNLNAYFASPAKRSRDGTASLLQAAMPSERGIDNCERDASKVCELEMTNGANGEIHESNSPLYIIKKPSVNSKLILQNMEEVLNSVKKKHRQKHRRKKEQKKLALLKAEAVAAEMNIKSDDKEISASLNFETLESPSKKHLTKSSGEDPGTDKARKQSQMIRISSKSETVPKNTSLINSGDVISALKTHETNKVDKKSKEKSSVTPKTNAFEVMMNARNKSIGSNTPGKEASNQLELASPQKNTKRKLMLQEWADRKGGNKRKLEEENRAAYIEKCLESRSKRFKEMLTGKVQSPKTKEDSQKFTKTKKVKRKRLSNAERKEFAENEIQEPPVENKSSKSGEESSDEDAKADVEDAEFLRNLSSPTKKRGDLLGFFPKKAQTPDLQVENKIGDIEKRPRRNQATRRSATENSVSSKELQKDESMTPVRKSGRVRRSCADKARYDYDLEETPTKSDKQISRISKSAGAPVIVVSDEELDVLDSDSTKSRASQRKKLAPLFRRALPKPNPDPNLVKARQEFLMSGVPEKLRIEQAKQRRFEQNYEEMSNLFPITSHVHQLTATEMDWLRKNVDFTFKWQLSKEESPLTASKTRRSKSKKIKGIVNIKLCEKANISTPASFKVPLPSVPDKRLIIKAWKADYERFPIYRCYNQMREKYRYFSAVDSGQNTEQLTESFVFTRRSSRPNQSFAVSEQDVGLDEAKPPAMAPNGELMFTEKYKPLFFEQFLVNLSPVSELRNFLVNWAAGSRSSQCADDTVDSENDSNSFSHQVLCNTVVLVGPSSSGKTSAVFAVANELNFNVLEINAGMKRTGKKLMQELQEATQSHQLRKSAHSKTQKNLLKKSLDGLKSKSKQSSSKNVDDDGSSAGNASELNPKATRKCLILIEDADILLDQVDAGFTDAIYTLAASSKRPVIVVSSNATCPHLQRLIQQNSIHFKEPNTLNISRYMSVLALLENCPVNLDDLISLYIYNKKDLRKTLLELQFFIQSGGDRNKVKEIQSDAPSLFASPTKRRFSEESNSTQGPTNDDVPNKETAVGLPEANMNIRIHQNLFHFFTAPQNQKWRIPYPVNFDLLRNNLEDIFQISNKLVEHKSRGGEAKPATPVEHTTKRKSRSPKKVWLTAAAAQQVKPLDYLCAFYENLSVACLLGLHQNDRSSLTETGTLSANQAVAEDVAYNLVANAIDCNLEATQFAYNFIYTPIKKITLTDGLTTNTILRNRHSLALDFEPSLRSICRSEKLRAINERRSTRFYHYLRNNSDIRGERLRNACGVFMENEECREITEASGKEAFVSVEL